MLIRFLLQNVSEAPNFKAASTLNEEYDDNLIPANHYESLLLLSNWKFYPGLPPMAHRHAYIVAIYIVLLLMLHVLAVVQTVAEMSSGKKRKEKKYGYILFCFSTSTFV